MRACNLAVPTDRVSIHADDRRLGAGTPFFALALPLPFLALALGALGPPCAALGLQSVGFEHVPGVVAPVRRGTSVGASAPATAPGSRAARPGPVVIAVCANLTAPAAASFHGPLELTCSRFGIDPLASRSLLLSVLEPL